MNESVELLLHQDSPSFQVCFLLGRRSQLLFQLLQFDRVVEDLLILVLQDILEVNGSDFMLLDFAQHFRAVLLELVPLPRD